MNNDHFGGENSMVVGAQDEYERQNDQELPHKRRARLRFSAPDDEHARTAVIISHQQWCCAVNTALMFAVGHPHNSEERRDGR